MSVYLARSAVDCLNEAQAELEHHLVTRRDGRCATCGGVEPCAARERLEAVFARYRCLPRRRPGVTRVGQRRLEGTDCGTWFDSGRARRAVAVDEAGDVSVER